jgi:hypothetical protein
MSAEKELGFFAAELRWSRGVEWYAAQFRDAPVRGEASPAYTLYPVFDGMPRRMAALVPEARLIYIVRDPLDRLLSHYRYLRFVLGLERLPLEEVVTDFQTSRYVAASSYHRQLEQYLAHFSADRILVLDQHDLLATREATMRRTYGFLGVDDAFVAPQFARVYNASAGLRANRGGHLAIHLLEVVVGSSRAAALRARVPLQLMRPLMHNQEQHELRLDPGLRSELGCYLGDQADRLRQLTGMRFASWTV